MDKIGAKYLALHILQRIIRFFWIHRHRYVLYIQDELTIHHITQKATLEDPRGCVLNCTRCGKDIQFQLQGTYKGKKWINARNHSGPTIVVDTTP